MKKKYKEWDDRLNWLKNNVAYMIGDCFAVSKRAA